MIERGALGRPLVGTCLTTWYRNAAYYDKPWRGRWDNELGGVTMGHGIHLLDLFLWLFGEWAEVSAMIGTLDRPIQVEDVSVATVRFASGALGSVVNSVLSPREETYLRLDLQRATVEVRTLYSYGNRHWTLTPAPGAEDVEWHVPADLLPVRIRLLRARHGWRQSDVADRLGISQQAYAKLERPGANPELDTLVRVERALEAPLLEFA